MKVLTVRQRADTQLVAFGPADGQYDPGFDPATMTKQIEDDYAAVLTEWRALPQATDRRTTAKASLKNAKTLPEALAALEQLL